jgi:hypothetical protein
VRVGRLSTRVGWREKGRGKVFFFCVTHCVQLSIVVVSIQISGTSSKLKRTESFVSCHTGSHSVHAYAVGCTQILLCDADALYPTATGGFAPIAMILSFASIDSPVQTISNQPVVSRHVKVNRWCVLP